ncbi:UNVERIFIED_CONTAM: putative pectinesterase/pectinesterase inhibitor 21 [Sesamum radiatum]|uniref:Pectinesterase n=1 Tax=Sesamum radiatum TaxID=300843 RepID=A0AAW2SNC7_SESRA
MQSCYCCTPTLEESPTTGIGDGRLTTASGNDDRRCQPLGDGLLGDGERGRPDLGDLALALLSREENGGAHFFLGDECWAKARSPRFGRPRPRPEPFQCQLHRPKELIKAAFDFTEKHIGDVIKKSSLFQEAAKDNGTKQALEICQEVLDTAIDDLKRSFDKFGEFDAAKANEYVEDLKTWLSAVITNHETCIDAFENTTGDTGEKMKNLMKTTREMSSNGLAMVTNMSSILSSLQIGGVTSRKLFSEEDGALFLSNNQRRLLAASSLKPNAVVALDGSGQFNTISAAIASAPPKNNQTFVIYVKAGLYKEYVLIPKKMNKIVLMGDGPLKTRISGRKNYAEGVKTFHTATVAVSADEFMAKDIGFENTAGAQGHQAVALRVSGDRAVFFNVHIDGYQDTLYAHTYRQYYRDCSISGTIDFIFGDALALFQNCKFVVRKPGPNQACMVTAQGRVDPRSLGATVIQNGDIVAEPALLQASPPREGLPWPPMEVALKDHYHAIQHRRVRCTRRLVRMAGRFCSRHTVLCRVPESRPRIGYEEPSQMAGDPTLHSTNGRELDGRENLWRG